MSEREYTLQELTSESGVTARTVRYYIAEGLLPPPVAAGPQSHYTDLHLDRLRLIAKLKEAYLPLREIRRQLDAMTDEEIAAAVDVPVETMSAPMLQETSPAASYIDMALERNAQRSERVLHSRSLTPPRRRPQREHRIETSNWTRIVLSEDAELFVRDETYRRKQEQLDSLITWARRILE